MRKLVIATALAVSTLFVQSTLAQDTNALTPAQQAEAQAILETARNLANYGETRSDALALVMAAKMMTDVPGRVLADGEEGGQGSNFDVDGLLTKAAELAPDNTTITELAAEVRAKAEEASRAVCYWEYYCYGGWCQYYYACF
jgi:hypothetical protein